MQELRARYGIQQNILWSNAARRRTGAKIGEGMAGGAVGDEDALRARGVDGAVQAGAQVAAGFEDRRHRLAEPGS